MLMKRAIEVAQFSEKEDDRLHPKVGAVLADEQGNEIMYAYRGQDGSGGHAEFTLLQNADKAGISLSDKTLFVTLEPCSRRSLSKTPCAVRVARSGIGTVYIGTLDPNPQIIGRGVNFLVESGVTVEHFPADLRTEIANLNVTFQGQHAYLVDPIVTDTDDEVAGRQRAGILATTLEIIASAKGEVRMFAGDASWLRDLFVGLLEAKLNGVDIRMIAQKPLEDSLYQRLAAIGIEVCAQTEDFGLRATMAMSGATAKQLVVIEPQPARHAQLFSAPHDGAVLGTFVRAFDVVWDESRARTASSPELRDVSIRDVAAALNSGVAQYQSAKIEIEQVNIGDLHFLTNDVEILKLRRVASTNRIMKSLGRNAPLRIVGTPWAFFPPIVERDSSGRMVLVDGVHRVYDAVQSGHTEIDSIVVDRVDAKLPATPVPVFMANILPRKRDRKDRYADYDESAFRPIRQALERGGWTASDPG